MSRSLSCFACRAPRSQRRPSRRIGIALPQLRLKAAKLGHDPRQAVRKSGAPFYPDQHTPDPSRALKNAAQPFRRAGSTQSAAPERAEQDRRRRRRALWRWLRSVATVPLRLPVFDIGQVPLLKPARSPSWAKVNPRCPTPHANGIFQLQETIRDLQRNKFLIPASVQKAIFALRSSASSSRRS